MGIARVALVWTAYQANILKCIMDQNGIASLDLLFIRDKIAGRTDLGQRAAKVAVVPDVYLSIREFLKAEAEVKGRVDAELPRGPFELWICNYEGPYGQRIMSNPGCVRVSLFEEGTGSYLSPKFIELDFGVKTAITMAVTRAIYLKNGHGPRLLPQERLQAVWSLFPGSFPQFRAPNRAISHDTFYDVLEKATGAKGKIPVGGDTALYLSSPLSDCNLVTREVDFEIVGEVFGKFLRENGHIKKVLWKAHPITPLDDSIAVAIRLSGELGIEVEVIRESINFEELIFALEAEAEIPVFATTSTSLYVAQVLSRKGLKVSSVRSAILLDAIKPAWQIYDMFDRIGINIIN